MHFPKYIQQILWLGGLLLVVSVIALGTSWFFKPTSVTPTPIPSSGNITIQGVMVCLPHKDTSGAQTLECAFGLQDDTGRYFALNDTDPTYKNISGVPMNTRVEVEGMFTPRFESNYQDIGIIAVTRITKISADTNDTDTSGIKGSTLLGPTCPVVRDPPDPKCADRPYETVLEVTTEEGTKVVKKFSTSAEGTFMVALPPGEYAIHSASASMWPHCGSSEAIQVTKGIFTEVTVFCDTGIR